MITKEDVNYKLKIIIMEWYKILTINNHKIIVCKR